LIAVGLAAIAIVTRLPFRSHRVFNWDAVNFVLALRDYDVRLHHPHPPGYPVFIGMGRAVQLVIPDPNAALVTVAMLLSAGAVAALFLLGKELFGRTVGIIAAIFLLCSVTFWTNGAVALAYPSLALFTTLVALFAWRCNQQGRTAPAWTPFALSAAYAIGGGFRPDLLLFLLPLWIFGHWRLPLRTIVLSGATVCAIVVAWFAPTIALSGGWSGYWKVFRAYTSDDVLKRYSVLENGPRALVVNIRDTVQYTGYALYALAIPVGGSVIWLLSRALAWPAGRARRPSDRSRLFIAYVMLFGLWLAPLMIFYVWVHIGDPGYVFTLVPALLLIGARFTADVPDILASRHMRPIARIAIPAILAFVIATNSAIFLFRPLSLTAHGIRQQDRTIDGKIAFVRSHGDPATTLLVSYESYRPWLLYLPEYRVQFVDVTYGTESDRTVTLPPGMTRAVLMDSTLLRALTDSQPTDATPVESDRVGIVSASPGAPLHFSPVTSPLGNQAPGG
jgi:hypothetical protein